MNTTTDNIKINKSARYAVELLESAGLRVTASKPGASPCFLVQDHVGNVHQQWCNTSALVNFANGVQLGIQVGRQIARG